MLASGLLANGLLLGESAPAAGGTARLKWLAEPGAESLKASGRAPAAGQLVLASVPGAAFFLVMDDDGSLRKLKRIAADPSAAYGMAVGGGRAVVAGRDGSVGLWTPSAQAGPTLHWRHDLGERVTSVAWDGSRVLAATWKNRLVALDGQDGRSLWSVDIGGKADAPAVTDGKDVFIATKAKTLFRIDAATGVTRWRKLLPGPALHPPVVFGQPTRTLVCGTWNGHLLAYDATSGEPRWSVPLPEKLAAAPVAVGDLVATVTTDGTVRGYGISGSVRWTAPRSSDGPTTLLVHTRPQAVPRLLAISNVLVALDPATGSRLAEYPRGAVEDLRRRFVEAMVEGVKTYSEGEKRALVERDAFDISGPVFGPARAFGTAVGFGTEEGWIYLFDADALRPTARYRAGPSCDSSPLAGGNVLAVGGEDVFALERDTGRVLWRRNVGAEAGRVVTQDTVGVLGGGRLNVLSAASGIVEWSLRGRFRSVSPQPPTPLDGSAAAPSPWLVDDGEGSLRALLPSGQPVGDPLPQGGDLLPVAAAGGRSWVAATREGTVFRVAWDGARLTKDWEMAVGERLADVRVAGGKLVLRSEAGALVCLDLFSRQESWRLRIDAEDRYQPVPEVGALLVLGARALRVLDLATGEQRSSQPLPVPAVGAELRGGRLLWLDRSGKAYRMGVDGSALPSGDIGMPLARAAAVPDGFVVTTAAGEIGFVEWIDSETTAGSGPTSQTGGRR